VEPKPGIPPSARHVHDLIALMAEREVEVLLAASYFSDEKVESIARRTGAAAVIVPLGPAETDGDAYFDLVGSWIDRLAEAFGR